MLDLRTRMRQGGGCTAVAAPGSEDFLGSLDTHEFDLFLAYGLTDRIAFELARGAITAARVAHPGTRGDVTLHRPANTANASNGSCSRIHKPPDR